MGAQQILRATGVFVAVTCASAQARTHERVAVIDLSNDASVRQKLAAEIVAAGLDPVVGDSGDGGVADALAGLNVDKDVVQLAAALDDAKRRFGELDCARATAS